MITIQNKIYITPWEFERVRYKEQMAEWPDKGKAPPEHFKFKRMSPDEFFKDLLDNRFTLCYSVCTYDTSTLDWVTLDSEEFLDILFPANFLSVGKVPVYICPSGKVITSHLEVVDWDTAKPVYQMFTSWEDYKTAVLGPYKNKI